MKRLTGFCFLSSFILFSGSAFPKTWNVGPGKTHTLPSQVAGLVMDGDTVNIDAGDYVDCASWNANNLLLRGVGGYARVRDKSCAGKAIWVLSGNNITVEHMEFSGATVPDKNGAGIRAQGGNLTVRYCYFHDNENGILGGMANTDILVEYSEFANNGFGDGYSHNIYINHVASFTLRYCYMHHAKIGHEVKSRANKNYILYNRIMDEAAGNASRNIDLPNGGLAIITGNLIEQGPNSGNSNIIGYGLEGLSNTAPHDLYLVNNTIVNDKSAGSFLSVQAGTGIVKMVNNIFAGPGTVLSGTPVTLDSTTNWISVNKAAAGLVNLAAYNYQLTSSSPAINKGSNPGSAGSYLLSPVYEYVHNSGRRNRPAAGTLDLGAYEYSPATAIPETFNEDEILIFPNPASSEVSIYYKGKEVSAFILYNIRGNRVLVKNTGERMPDVSQLDPGVYLLQIQLQHLQVFKKLMIIR